MSKNYVLIDNVTKYIEAAAHLDRYELIAYDTETTGLNVRKEKIIGLSFTGEIGVGYYYPIFVYNVELDKLEYHPFYLEKDLTAILNRLKAKKLIMHNASFDIRVTLNDLKVSLLNSLYADTVLMEHTLNEDGPFGLKEICILKALELGLDEQDAANQEQLELKESVIARGGSWTQQNKEMFKAELGILAKYACADVDMTLRLYLHNLKRLEQENLTKLFFEDEVMPLYKLVTIRMEHRGVYIDMPKLEKLSIKIVDQIKEYEKVVIDSLTSTPEFNDFITTYLNATYPISTKGNFAQEICRFGNLDLPTTAKGKYSITNKNVLALPDSIYKSYLLSGEADYIPESNLIEMQRNLHRKAEDSPYLINLSSKAQLKTLVFDYLKVEPLSRTDKGSPQFNDKFVESIAKTYDWAEKIRVFNKLNKIKSSYFDRFAENTEDGIYYPSFMQHGTSSGRYSSDFQQLPKPKDEDGDDHPLVVEFSDSVRELVIPAPDHAFIDDDYESLEPRCFADDAGDDALIKIFTDNLDMYSVVAIGAEKITDASADKKSPDFLKKKYPSRRQNAKGYALGIRYGMKAFKLSKTLNISIGEADAIIHNYFKAFPGLKNAMDKYLKEVKTTGKVTSKFGRVRHLPRAKEIYQKFGDDIADYNNLRKISQKTYVPIMELKVIRKEYNNLLNNSLNFPIQSAATSIVNRAAIAMTRQFIKNHLRAWVSLQIHDQLVISCAKEDIDKVKTIVQDCMENTNLLLMPLVAKPEVAYNLREGH
jgi:DNA polymerase I-like protein with 3'-5' exonuclease and polymerase domains